MATDPASTPVPPGPPQEPAVLAKAPAAPLPAQERAGWFASGGAGDQIVVYHHSTLFYWWPVWLIGFILAGWTVYFGDRLVIVPDKTEAAPKRQVDISGNGKDFAERDVLILPPGKGFSQRLDDDGELDVEQPKLHVARDRRLGTVYALTLLMVIAMTSISVRGLWSVFILLLVMMLTIIFALSGWWGIVFANLNQLCLYINLGGYVLISSVLCILWFISVFFFDRQTYMIFTPGQVRVRLVIGGEETVYDATGMVVQRQRNDLFRHFVLGFGSGDLLIRPVGLAQPLELDNVLGVNGVVRRIEKLTKERVVVRGSSMPAR